jgi:hypothetical protein
MKNNMIHIQKFESFNPNDLMNNFDQAEKLSEILNKLKDRVDWPPSSSALVLKLKMNSKVSIIKIDDVRTKSHTWVVEIDDEEIAKNDLAKNTVVGYLQLPGDFVDLQPLEDKRILIKFIFIPNRQLQAVIRYGSVNLRYEVLDMTLLPE